MGGGGRWVGGPPGAGQDHPLQLAVGKTGPGSRGSGWRRWQGAPWRGCGLRAGDGCDPRQGVTEGAGVWAGAAEAVVAGPWGRPPRLGLQDARWRCCPRLEGAAGRDPELRARPQPGAQEGPGLAQGSESSSVLKWWKKVLRSCVFPQSPYVFLPLNVLVFMGPKSCCLSSGRGSLGRPPRD